MAENVNGPSMICVPPWVDDTLGEYYLYFANPQGRYIYQAYADLLAGPWTMYEPGTLRVDDTPLSHHVASADVHLDHETETVWLYYHGVNDYDAYMQFDGPADRRQASPARATVITFGPASEPFGTPYLRWFRYRDMWYFLGGRGHLYHSADSRSAF